MFNVILSTFKFRGQGVVALRGELDLADAPSVAAQLSAAVEAYGPRVIVDLEDLEYIDSSGLGVLVRVLKKARGNGGDLPLAAPQGMVRRVLTATGLMGVFSVYPSLEEAVQASQPPLLTAW
ncbi:MAG TPA: STAS domain-containing protein [Streptosporangiaceae bacterium]|nr:STAS domain-containing protein [Streptosporangiaceae bacterium]